MQNSNLAIEPTLVATKRHYYIMKWDCERNSVWPSAAIFYDRLCIWDL